MTFTQTGKTEEVICGGRERDYESAMGFVKSRRRQEVVELKRGVGWIPKCINW